MEEQRSSEKTKKANAAKSPNARVQKQSGRPPKIHAKNCKNTKKTYQKWPNKKATKEQQKAIQRPPIRATSRLGPQRAPLSGWCLPGASGMASPRGANERKPCKKQTRTVISKRQPYRVRAVHPNRGEAKLCCLKHVCMCI